jgi:hypothetical protein
VDPKLFDDINVVAQVPNTGPIPLSQGDPVYSIYQMQTTTDWVTHPATVVSYGNALIGESGAINIGAISAVDAQRGALSAAQGADTRIASGLVAKGLTVVGSQGLSLSQAKAIQTNQVKLP